MTLVKTEQSPVIVALDYASGEQALAFVKQLERGSCRLKVGKELFTRSGPDLVRELSQAGFDVFLDLKYHDIPNTVARACEAAAELGVWMMNVHASGGLKMMQAARQALDKLDGKQPLLIAVTVLTSMNDEDLAGIGISEPAENQVLRLAHLAQQAGLDGVVCSPKEATLLRRELGSDFLLVTPGVRPAGSAADDQSRIMTPVEAIDAGSDYLVIGRPITQSKDPVKTLTEINQSLGINQ
jgi:orotidine-5'-phosphate decarboxylase